MTIRNGVSQESSLVSAKCLFATCCAEVYHNYFA